MRKIVILFTTYFEPSIAWHTFIPIEYIWLPRWTLTHSRLCPNISGGMGSFSPAGEGIVMTMAGFLSLSLTWKNGEKIFSRISTIVTPIYPLPLHRPVHKIVMFSPFCSRNVIAPVLRNTVSSDTIISIPSEFQAQFGFEKSTVPNPALGQKRTETTNRAPSSHWVNSVRMGGYLRSAPQKTDANQLGDYHVE